MQYAELLIEHTEQISNDVKSAERESEEILRNVELLAMLGEVLVSEGMDDFDDEDYAAFSRGLTSEARDIAAMINRGDYQTVGAGVAKLRQRCDACHEEYR